MEAWFRLGRTVTTLVRTVHTGKREFSGQHYKRSSHSGRSENEKGNYLQFSLSGQEFSAILK